jgi:hypothetical protein
VALVRGDEMDAVAGWMRTRSGSNTMTPFAPLLSIFTSTSAAFALARADHVSAKQAAAIIT